MQLHTIICQSLRNDLKQQQTAFPMQFMSTVINNYE